VKLNPNIIEPLTKDEFMLTYDNKEILTKNKKDSTDLRYQQYYEFIITNLKNVVRKNDVNSQYLIGNYIADGRVKLANNANRTKTAIEWMIPAVNDGNLLAAYRVGQLYLDIKDTISAAEYFRKCVSKMDEEALNELNWEYEYNRFKEINGKQPL